MKGAHVQNEQEIVPTTGFHPLELEASPKAEQGTALDEDDMTRIGKTQEFKVCHMSTSHSFVGLVLIMGHDVEKSPTIGCAEFCLGASSYLGVYLDVRRACLNYTLDCH